MSTVDKDAQLAQALQMQEDEAFAARLVDEEQAAFQKQQQEQQQQQQQPARLGASEDTLLDHFGIQWSQDEQESFDRQHGRVVDAMTLVPRSMIRVGLSSARSMLGLPPRRDLDDHESSLGFVQRLRTRTRDNSLLEERLKSYGLKRKRIKGDGNCLFRSLGFAMVGDPGKERATIVRDDVITEIAAFPERYREHTEDLEGYLAEMGRDGTWGDHLAVAAASNAYGVPIRIICSDSDVEVVQLDPVEQRLDQLVFITFNGSHFDAVLPIDAEDDGNDSDGPCVLQ